MVLSREQDPTNEAGQYAQPQGHNDNAIDPNISLRLWFRLRSHVCSFTVPTILFISLNGGFLVFQALSWKSLEIPSYLRYSSIDSLLAKSLSGVKGYACNVEGVVQHFDRDRLRDQFGRIGPKQFTG
jgi:hypothetical protein